WAAAQIIVWNCVPIYNSDSTVDIISQNAQRPFFFKNIESPDKLEDWAIANDTLSINFSHHAHSFKGGRFKYPNPLEPERRFFDVL
ncbi:Hypothetical protein FKW44_005233, partial [Caligus rogercresseyi]